jgi:hypothetical protein
MHNAIEVSPDPQILYEFQLGQYFLCSGLLCVVETEATQEDLH